MSKLPEQFQPLFHHRRGIIYARNSKGEPVHALDVRGRGYLTGLGAGGLGLSEAEAGPIQSAFGNWVADALNRAAELGDRFDEISFTMKEISDAVGIKSETLCGVSYAAKELDIPLPDGSVLRFREGDDAQGDHCVVKLQS